MASFSSRSFSTKSFSTRAWLFDVVQTAWFEVIRFAARIARAVKFNG